MRNICRKKRQAKVRNDTEIDSGRNRDKDINRNEDKQGQSVNLSLFNLSQNFDEDKAFDLKLGCSE